MRHPKPLVSPGLPDRTRVRLTADAEPAVMSATAQNVDFDAELKPLLFDGPNLPPNFSRADIYTNHD
jgi:hypothetical protein